MIQGYRNVEDKANEWGISKRRIQLLCSQGRIVGAEKFGKMWVIPEKAEKPSDNRETSGAYKKWRRKESMIINDISKLEG